MLKRERIEKALLELGIFPNLKGFTYVTDMIMIIDSGKTDKKMEMYKMICKEHKIANVTTIVRAIRTAFEHADYYKDTQEYKKYIGKSVTTTEKMYTIHNVLTRENGYNELKQKAEENNT